MKTLLLISTALLVTCTMNNLHGQRLKSRIQKSVESFAEESVSLDPQVKQMLESTAQELASNFSGSNVLDIVLVDNNNTFQSQLAQVWLQSALYYYELPTIRVYSAGLTADKIDYAKLVNLETAGFNVRILGDNDSGSIVVSFSRDRWTLYSKQMDDKLNKVVNLIFPLNANAYAKLSSNEKYNPKIMTSLQDFEDRLNEESIRTDIAIQMVYLAKQLKDQL